MSECTACPTNLPAFQHAPPHYLLTLHLPFFDGSKPADITTAWQEVLLKTNINNRFHDLRHTAASHLAMNGASTLEIAAILGT